MKKISCIFLCLFFITNTYIFTQNISISLLPSTSQDETTLLIKSREAFSHSLYKESLDNASTYIQNGGKDSALAYFEIGNAYFGLDEKQNAIKAYIKSISTDKNNKTKADAYYNIGYAYQLLLNNDNAIAYYSKALSINSKCYMCYKNMGTIYTTQTNPETAIKYFNKSLKIMPDTTTYTSLGRTYFDLGKTKKAISTYQKSINLIPTKDAYIHIGNLYLLQRKYKKAIKNYKQADLINHTTEGYIGLGYAYMDLRNYDKCINNLEKSLYLKPDPDIYTELANAYRFKGDTAKAYLSYTNALKLDSMKAEPYFGLGLIEKDTTKAINFLFKARQLGSDSADFWITKNGYPKDEKYTSQKVFTRAFLLIKENNANKALKAIKIIKEYIGNGGKDSLLANFLTGYAYFALKDYDKTIEYEKKINSTDETHIAAMTLTGYAYYYKQNKDSFFLMINNAIDKDSTNYLRRTDVHKTISDIGSNYFENKDYDSAIKCQKLSLSISTETKTYILLADAYGEKKDYKNSLINYEIAYQTDSSLFWLLNNYAYTIAISGNNLKEAEHLILKALEIDSTNYYAIGTYAWIKYLQGDNALAKKYIAQACKLSKKINAIDEDHYGDILNSLGEKDEAVKHWLNASIQDPTNSDSFRKIGNYYKQKGKQKLSQKYFEKEKNINENKNKP